MNDASLALGLVGALALGAAARRGGRALETSRAAMEMGRQISKAATASRLFSELYSMEHHEDRIALGFNWVSKESHRDPNPNTRNAEMMNAMWKILGSLGFQLSHRGFDGTLMTWRDAEAYFYKVHDDTLTVELLDSKMKTLLGGTTIDTWKTAKEGRAVKPRKPVGGRNDIFKRKDQVSGVTVKYSREGLGSQGTGSRIPQCPIVHLMKNGKRLGHLQLSRLNVGDEEWEDSESCLEDVLALKRQLPAGTVTYVAWRSLIYDDKNMGRGHGVQLYEAMMKNLKEDIGGEVILVPEVCMEGGTTSGMAERVWESLTRRWLHVGRAVSSVPLEAGSRAVSPVLSVPVDKLWTRPEKMEETLQDIEAGRLSYSKNKPAIVSRLDEPRGHFFVIDGHHRIAEHILDGQNRVGALVDVHMPRIERTGGAYRRWVDEKVPVGAKVRAWRSERKAVRSRAIAAAIRSFGNDEEDLHTCYKEGLCGDVAHHVHWDTLRNFGLEAWHEDQLGEMLPAHTWVFDPVTGLHHDLGNPEGVSPARDMLYFAKKKGKWSPGLHPRARFFANPKTVAEMGDE